MIEPSPSIARAGHPDYSGLLSKGSEGENIIGVRWLRYNLVHIGPFGEGGPMPGGITTGDPEDVRWFARELLGLADRMEANAPAREPEPAGVQGKAVGRGSFEPEIRAEGGHES